MDIEIYIRTGNRKRLNSGSVIWENQTDDSLLITYDVNKLGAVREALYQVERMLRKSLGMENKP